MITYERWREAYLVKYRGALYVNYNSQKLLFPHNACTASEASRRRPNPPHAPLLGPGPEVSACGAGAWVRDTHLGRHCSLVL